MLKKAKKIDDGATVFALLLVLVFIFSAVIYFIKMPCKRYVFRFESVDKGKSALEYRILPRKSRDETITLYVEELLLGPKTERYRPVFSSGTKLIFCFLRQKTLYINLSSEMLYKGGNASEIMDGIKLFKKNIFRTFPLITEVELYIDGKIVLKENNKK